MNFGCQNRLAISRRLRWCWRKRRVSFENLQHCPFLGLSRPHIYWVTRVFPQFRIKRVFASQTFPLLCKNFGKQLEHLQFVRFQGRPNKLRSVSSTHHWHGSFFAVKVNNGSNNPDAQNIGKRDYDTYLILRDLIKEIRANAKAHNTIGCHGCFLAGDTGGFEPENNWTGPRSASDHQVHGSRGLVEHLSSCILQTPVLCSAFL